MEEDVIEDSGYNIDAGYEGTPCRHCTRIIEDNNYTNCVVCRKFFHHECITGNFTAEHEQYAELFSIFFICAECLVKVDRGEFCAERLLQSHIDELLNIQKQEESLDQIYVKWKETQFENTIIKNEIMEARSEFDSVEGLHVAFCELTRVLNWASLDVDELIDIMVDSWATPSTIINAQLEQRHLTFTQAIVAGSITPTVPKNGTLTKFTLKIQQIHTTLL